MLRRKPRRQKGRRFVAPFEGRLPVGQRSPHAVFPLYRDPSLPAIDSVVRVPGSPNQLDLVFREDMADPPAGPGVHTFFQACTESVGFTPGTATAKVNARRWRLTYPGPIVPDDPLDTGATQWSWDAASLAWLSAQGGRRLQTCSGWIVDG